MSCGLAGVVHRSRWLLCSFLSVLCVTTHATSVGDVFCLPSKPGSSRLTTSPQWLQPSALAVVSTGGVRIVPGLGASGQGQARAPRACFAQEADPRPACGVERSSSCVPCQPVCEGLPFTFLSVGERGPGRRERATGMLLVACLRTSVLGPGRAVRQLAPAFLALDSKAGFSPKTCPRPYLHIKCFPNCRLQRVFSWTLGVKGPQSAWAFPSPGQAPGQCFGTLRSRPRSQQKGLCLSPLLTRGLVMKTRSSWDRCQPVGQSSPGSRPGHGVSWGEGTGKARRCGGACRALASPEEGLGLRTRPGVGGGAPAPAPPTAVSVGTGWGRGGVMEGAEKALRKP